MSNRSAASRISDRVELVAWTPQTSRWAEFRATAESWLRQDTMPHPVPPQLRRDLGLADAAAAGDSVLDFEARRLGF
jgi:hypothetical protein